MTVSLDVINRDGAASLDRVKQVFGVVYGPKQEAVSVAVDRAVFERLYKDAGESTIISLQGIGEPLDVLIHDVDFDPVKSMIRHVDFYAIERGKEITVDVPLTYVGHAPAEEKEGVLNKVLHEIEVTCRPSKLPHSIEVDVSGLEEIDAQIKVADLVIPDGVTVENAPEDVVAVIVAVEEEPEEPAEAVDMDAIEVEGKGTEEEAAPAEEKE